MSDTGAKRVAVLCDPVAALGLGLAGLATEVAEGAVDARRRLDEMAADDSLGVILIQEGLVPDLAERPAAPDAAGLPIVVPFPAPALEARPGAAESYVAELLRRAVGYRVRLR